MGREGDWLELPGRVGSALDPMIPHPSARRILLLGLALFVQSPLHAQDMRDSIMTPRGVCRIWAISPGGSVFPTDASYSRCALDRAPAPVAGMRMPSSSIGFQYANGTFMVVVNPNGTVDSSLTRAFSIGMDTAFYRELLETMRQWRFVPGTRGGKAVRNAVSLEVVTPQWRNDTLAGHPEWSYHTGTLTDTLLGRWIRDTDPPPYAEDRVDSVYVASIRRLVAMQVVTPDRTVPHCLVIPGVDSSRRARLSLVARRLVYGRDGGGTFAPTGCESDAASIRLTLGKVYRTENDRVVMHVSGDRLLEWPRNLSGKSWRFWNGRCVGLAAGSAQASIDCAISVDRRRERPPEEMDGRRERPSDELEAKPSPRHRAATSERGPYQLRLLVTTAGAYWTDTLKYEVRGRLPSFRESAVTDSLPRCNAWQVLSTQRSKDLIVLDGDPTGDDLQVTEVQHSASPLAGPKPRSGSAAPRRAKLAAFLLGDVGAKADAPIALRFPQCARTYVLVPARHTLVQRAHAQFRISDLRPQTRPTGLFGIQLLIHIDLDPVPADVVALVVLHDGSSGRYSAWFADSISFGLWKHDVMYGSENESGYPLGSTLSVYLIRR